jgi:hypothetical protein
MGRHAIAMTVSSLLNIGKVSCTLHREKNDSPLEIASNN